MYCFHFILHSFIITAVFNEVLIPDKIRQDILHSSSYAESWQKYVQVYYNNHDSDAPVLSSGLVESKRQRRFIDNIKLINKHNKNFGNGLSTFSLGVNIFTVMDNVERKAYKGFNVSSIDMLAMAENLQDSTEDGSLNNILQSELPDSVDWISEGYVTPVKNQRSCGSCWAFGMIGAFEYGLKKASGKLVSLSEQEFLDCTYEGEDRDGCRGAFYKDAAKFVTKHQHLATSADYPYVARTGSCKFRQYPNALKGWLNVKEYRTGRQGDTDIESDLYMAKTLHEFGPIPLVVYADADFSAYNSGIFDSNKNYASYLADHAVFATGYTAQYFNVKNSWGINWGEQGYIKIRRRKNVCNILERWVYLVFEDDNKRDKDDNKRDKKEYDSNDKKYDEHVCEDLDDDCQSFVDQGYCRKGEGPIILKRPRCRKSCAYCTDESDEKEEDSDDRDDRDDRDNDDRNDTNGKCSDSSKETAGWHCEYWSSIGFCKDKNLHEFMKKHCASACNLC